MGIFDYFRKPDSGGSREAVLGRFYATQVGWENYSSERQILGFLRAHPHWKLVDESVLMELTRRIIAPPFQSVAYNYANGFSTLVTICEKYSVVDTNFVPICRDDKGVDGGTAGGKLWMFAWTLQRLASRFMSEARTMSPDSQLQTIGERFADARIAAEACLTVDPWFCPAYTLLPIAWMSDPSLATFGYGASEAKVQRTCPELRGEARKKAIVAVFHQWVAAMDNRVFAICDEGLRICEYVKANASSLPCSLDQEFAEAASDVIGEIEAVRKRLIGLRAQEGEASTKH